MGQLVSACVSDTARAQHQPSKFELFKIYKCLMLAADTADEPGWRNCEKAYCSCNHAGEYNNIVTTRTKVSSANKTPVVR